MSDESGYNTKNQPHQVTTTATVFPTLKLDHAGLPLIPQPTDSPFDPLNYPTWLKYTILVEVSLLAALATLNWAIVNPAVVALSEEFNISHVVATYQSTVAIGTGALGPLIFTPFANIYGRRPAYLLSVFIGFASALGAAETKSYGALIVVRILNGFGQSAALGLGAGTVVDLFYTHERGKTMGIFTLILTNGAHLAPIIGGYVARNLGWRWCFWAGAIMNGALFVICLFLLPETLFERPANDLLADTILAEYVRKEETKNTESDAPVIDGVTYKPPSMEWKIYLNRLWFWDLQRPPTRTLHLNEFIIKPLGMLKYPSVLFPAIYFSVTYGFASIEPALTLATIFTEVYHFNTVQIGLANGLSLLIGTALGELCSGPVTDAMMQSARRRALKRGETAPAEVRLQGIWTGAIMMPIGLIMILISDGTTVHFVTTFVAPCIGMAVACFGIQIVSSVCYTYSCSDCYRSRSNDVSQCFNVFRQLFGLTLGFYSIPFGQKIGYEWSFSFFAAMCIITFLPIIALMFRGEKWRRRIGEPKEI